MTRIPLKSSAPATQSGGAHIGVKTKTVTLVCEECETPREFSQSELINWTMQMLPEPERCCRVCGLSFKQCPVGGM
jgi:hypothetical protein